MGEGLRRIRTGLSAFGPSNDLARTHPNGSARALSWPRRELGLPIGVGWPVAQPDHPAVKLGVALAAVMLALADRRARSRGHHVFETPSKNIVCGTAFSGAGQTELECGIVSGLVPPAPKPKGGCHGIDPRVTGFKLSPTGRPAGFCSGDAGVFAEQGLAPVLAYGHTWHKGGLRLQLGDERAHLQERRRARVLPQPCELAFAV